MKMLIMILGLLASSASVFASEVELYCKVKDLQDAPSWQIIFIGNKANIVPNDYFPKEIQIANDVIAIQKDSPDLPTPLASYTGKNLNGSTVVFRLTSLDLINSMEWKSTNFYEGYIGLSGEGSIYINLQCSGPKTGVSF